MLIPKNSSNFALNKASLPALPNRERAAKAKSSNDIFFMKKLLSLPPNLVDCFHKVTGLSRDEWFCTNDPVGRKLGSGGGTTWVLQEHAVQYPQDINERKIILHAGGQSRRLPAYAPSGKILTPIPVFRWERGQKLSQDLLSLQIPLYERIMRKAPESLTTMIVSGDVYIRATKPLQDIPEADVVCYGLWLDDSIAKDHGVFVSSRKDPSTLQCMLQKPSVDTLHSLRKDHYYLVDIGIWILSERAVQVLMNKSKDKDGNVVEYDLYSDFGCALGTEPSQPDEMVAPLTVAILPLPGGEFYHYGTTPEIISSTLAIQNLVVDQREIMHRSRKAHPSIFVQNADIRIKLNENNSSVWIENSFIGSKWTLANENVITGVPENDWEICLEPGQCIDIIPINDKDYVVRPYGFRDKFAGKMQQTPMFPIVDNVDDMGIVLRWMIGSKMSGSKVSGSKEAGSKVSGSKEAEGEEIFNRSEKISAEMISARANLVRLTEQRKQLRAKNWTTIAENHEHSVFYQTDLSDAANEFAQGNIDMPAEIGNDEALMTRIHDAMFRSEVERQKNNNDKAQHYDESAFELLRQGLTEPMLIEKQSPKMSTYSDQIVWGRSPVRIDLAGGWTDTPPYCLMEGGSVVNIAIELNGQQPIQTYVRPCKEPHIILRSIDLGASETITTYEELKDFHHVGSPFSIPKAALVLCGFQPGFSTESYPTLLDQLKEFGCGIEVTLLSAIPAGSGLGTSSVLAATVLGSLNDFCGLCWDKNEIGRRTLVLEQLLTTGGGWQDQFGGILHGCKLLTTERGFEQNPQVSWVPSTLFSQPEYKACHLLYYTGITRTAKKLLAEIVRKMFLNNGDEIRLLREMKQHANDMYEALQHNDFNLMGRLVGKTWQQNQLIDAGTNPAGVDAITKVIDDLCLGYKLPGAGGGGYLYMVAKDPEAAAIIKQRLTANPQNPNARFVDMTISETGLQVSRS